MHCVEYGEALESILERLRKVRSVCYSGHRFRAGHRPADLASSRSTDGEGPERSRSWGLAGPGDGGHDATGIIPHIHQGDPADGPVMKERVEELPARVHGQGERVKARMLHMAEVIARAERAVTRARLAQERTAALLVRLESTWGIRYRQARKTVASPPRREPTGPSAGPRASPDPADSSPACLSSMSEVGNPPT